MHQGRGPRRRGLLGGMNEGTQHVDIGPLKIKAKHLYERNDFPKKKKKKGKGQNNKKQTNSIL